MHEYRFLDFLSYKTTKIISYDYNNNKKYINQNNTILTHFNQENKKENKRFFWKRICYDGNILRSTYLAFIKL